VVDPGFVEPEFYETLGALFMKKNKNYEYKIRKESKYLFRAPPRTLEGVRASEVT
jgi:hypothetical protein